MGIKLTKISDRKARIVTSKLTPEEKSLVEHTKQAQLDFCEKEATEQAQQIVREIFEGLEDSTYTDWGKDLFFEIDIYRYKALKQGTFKKVGIEANLTEG